MTISCCLSTSVAFSPTLPEIYLLPLAGYKKKAFQPIIYRERAVELEEIASCLSSLLDNLDKLTDSVPELLGTTTEIRKEIFSSVEIGHSVISGKK